MYRRVTLYPIGQINHEILEFISTIISKHCGLDCNISPGIESPAYAYDETRCQYNSKLILNNSTKVYSENTLKIMGVTHLDLYVPILKYVYGLAQIQGRGAIISTHRLDPCYYDQKMDQPLFFKRIEKTALHELGHTFGLIHCRDKRCVMYSSTRIEDTDNKGDSFCPTCFELFKWYLEKAQ